jgi:hypothetical protein
LTTSFAAERADQGRARRIVVDLEHHRKDAKRLLRAYRAGESSAVARAQAALGTRAPALGSRAPALGSRAPARFVLTDAQHVIAVEHGYRSWPELRRAVPGRRTDSVIDTPLAYQPGDRISLRRTERPPRLSISDDGAALAKAGHPATWRRIADRLARELDVNISRHGVISLPVVAAGPGEEAIVRRIAAASQRFYDELLELGTADIGRGGGLHSTDDDRRPRHADRRSLPRA